MRINSNKKIHKMKRDPYKTLLRAAGILAIVVVVGIGIFYLCSLAVTNDYVTKRNAIEKQKRGGRGGVQREDERAAQQSERDARP